MASYSPIGNGEVDPESPITSSLMVRLRDNPLAIQEGDPSAPKIQLSAMDPQVQQNNLVFAWCRFDGTGGNGNKTPVGSYNCTVNKNGTGDYTVSYIQPAASQGYSVVISVGTGQAREVIIESQNATSVRFRTYFTPNLQYSNADIVNVTVIGGFI